MRALLYRIGVFVTATTLVACEGGDAHISGPVGRDMFARFVAIGTGLSMGVQSGGVLYHTQVQAWPALLAHQAGAEFVSPLLRSPGCSPPLISPLGLSRLLSGTSAAVRDSSCAGVLATAPPPLDNLSLPGATAWHALNLTPKLAAASPATYDVGDRSRYPLVLGLTQSQVTAMLVRGASLVSVELGAAEVLDAATGGLVNAAAAYPRKAPATYVPATLFGPVYAAIADSVKKSGARVVLLSVPRVSTLGALRAGSELWTDRAALAAFNVVVAADCNGSSNRVFTAAVVPALAARALTTGAGQPLSCADVAGATDHVLTPGDIVTLDAVVDQMNDQVRQLAEHNGWAFLDLNLALGAATATRAPYGAATELNCASPYGQYVSLDGVQPTVAGQQLIANAAAMALNARYRIAIPVVSVAPLAAAQLCP